MLRRWKSAHVQKEMFTTVLLPRKYNIKADWYYFPPRNSLTVVGVLGLRFLERWVLAEGGWWVGGTWKM